MAIFAFLAPQLLAMRLPVIGPLLFLPAAAAAAYLADFLHRQPANFEFVVGPTAAAAGGRDAGASSHATVAGGRNVAADGSADSSSWRHGSKRRQTADGPATRPAAAVTRPWARPT